MDRPLVLLDCDDTLYDYDFRFRLPTLSRLTGRSQYALARDWWVSGGERGANAGSLRDGDSYLAAFRAATGTTLDRAAWRTARAAAMSERPATFAALEGIRAEGRVRLAILTNNPAIFGEEFAALAPRGYALVEGRVLVSGLLGMAKPDPEIYRRALDALGGTPAHSLMVDDSAANIAGARAAGLHALHVGTDDAAAAVALEQAVAALCAGSARV